MLLQVHNRSSACGVPAYTSTQLRLTSLCPPALVCPGYGVFPVRVARAASAEAARVRTSVQVHTRAHGGGPAGYGLGVNAPPGA